MGYSKGSASGPAPSSMWGVVGEVVGEVGVIGQNVLVLC